jgi:two-component system, OmpR family, sensor histidine kinase KdpD
MKTKYFKQSLLNQYLLSIFSVILIAAICYICSNLIGYRSVALLLLATVSVLAIFFTVYPVLVAATLSALIWDFFFIPPHFTFHIESSDDILMLLMYFVIALINGVLTSKVRQLEKLQLQREERQMTIKLYKTLFNSISHELRTPIATIVGASDNLLQKNSNISENDKEKLFSEISIAAFRLNRLISNLLNMQRLESGQLKLKLEWCDINELINSTINQLKSELSNYKLEIIIQPEFPIIKLDFGLMEQAIFNILHNATLYTPINSEIKIICNFVNNNVVIVITDNGKGFTEDVLKNIFSKFYVNEKQKIGGIGLGLSIVKGFTEAHNGSIKVENNIPSGAKFTLQIPTEIIELNDDFDFTDLIIKQEIKNEHKSEHSGN